MVLSMSFLSRFRILTKVLAVIGLLSAITLGITVLSINALKQVSEQTALVARSSDEAILASRMNANVLAISGAEARIAADPRLESRSEARAEIEKEAATFKQRLEQIGRLAQSAESKARLGELEKEWINYNQELENVYRAAEAVQNFQIPSRYRRCG
jgi:methyl-accepting chemotaxis protein